MANTKDYNPLTDSSILSLISTTPSSNGRTPNFEFGNCGSNPRGVTIDDAGGDNNVKSQEVRLWRAVILQMAKDALAFPGHGKGQIFGSERAFTWVNGKGAKLMCEHAQLNHDAVVEGFRKIRDGELRGNIHKLHKPQEEIIAA